MDTFREAQQIHNFVIVTRKNVTQHVLYNVRGAEKNVSEHCR